MSKKKKVAGFVFVPLLLIMALPAWGGGRGELRGQEITIGQWWTGFDVNTFQPQSDLDHRVLAYRKRIQQEHGFTMREVNLGSWTEYLQRTAISIMAGAPAASVFWMESAWAMNLYRQDLIVPITGNVDFSPSTPGDGRPDWSQAVMNAFNFGGTRYAMSVNFHYQPLVMFFNKRLFREAGIDPTLPYDMQRDRTWTWANFLPIARQLTRDIDGDGITDTWALPRDLATDILDAVIASNGATYVDRDSNGRFVNATTRPEFVEALEFALSLWHERLMLMQPEGANWDWNFAAFMDGRVAMLVAPMWVRDSLMAMTDDWGMVMFPRGPRMSDYAVFTTEHVLVIPAGTPPDQVQRITSAVNLWFTPVDTSPYAWQDALWHVFRDSRAVTETMAIVRDPRRAMVQYHRFIPGLERGHIAWNMWYNEGDPSQLIEEVYLAWNALIADVNADL